MGTVKISPVLLRPVLSEAETRDQAVTKVKVPKRGAADQRLTRISLAAKIHLLKSLLSLLRHSNISCPYKGL
jgi:hypothetical protein